MIWVSGVNEFERPDGIGKVSNGNTDLSATDFSVFERPDGIGKVSNWLVCNCRLYNYRVAALYNSGANRLLISQYHLAI